jgi:thiamine biosynthesis lipoprotein
LCRIGHLALFCFVCVVLLLLPVRSAFALTLEREEILMGTQVQAVLCGPDRQALEGAMEAVFSEVAKAEERMSFWRQDSEIARINRSAGVSPVRVSPELFRLIEEALSISRMTKGCFDITMGVLVGLWDFRAEVFRVPSESEIQRRLALVGFQDVRLDPHDGSVFLTRTGMSVTLGGIAKGYAVDRAVQATRSLGVHDGIVSAGGDLMAFGRKESGELWKVGVKNPRDNAKIVCVVPVSNAAVATSGDYERFRMVDGVRYHHILDPRTGYPARGCLSATVVAKQATEADALATAAFVLGPEEGIALLESLPDTAGVIVGGDGKVRTTSGFAMQGAPEQR